MYLFIDATIKGRLALKIFDARGIRLEKERAGGNKLTEELTGLIVDTLAQEKLQLNDLKGIAIVNGPGGFTSVRVSCLVANMLGQLLDIPIYGAPFEKFPDEKHIVGSISKMKKGRVVLPEYGKEPNITL